MQIGIPAFNSEPIKISKPSNLAYVFSNDRYKNTDTNSDLLFIFSLQKANNAHTI